MNRLRVFTALSFVTTLAAHADAAPSFAPEFDPAAGEFRFELPAREAAGEPLTLPPVSFNGELQTGFGPVRGRPHAYENDLLSVEWTQAAPGAVAITWSVREQVPGEFAIRI
ncbi:MAG TPA: hypothetical protein VNQ14_16005, partial [Woeseiaceae bacterium]|nr:hypothetical protein [Woeseiaceae bacterium]